MTTYTFAISLASIRGELVNTRMEYLVEAPLVRTRDLDLGDTVHAVDEDGERYLAVVESVRDNGWFGLRLKAEPMPQWEITGMTSARMGQREDDLNKPIQPANA